jgi:hypothetical protein
MQLFEQIDCIGMDLAFGWLPAEKARNLPNPARLRIASAMIERAELPVQRKQHAVWLGHGLPAASD